MSVLNKLIIKTNNCNAIFITYKIPKPVGIYNNTTYVVVQSQIIDDYLLDELIQYNTNNKFVKNIFYFELLNNPDPNNPITWVVQFTPSSSKWASFSSNLKTLGFNFAFTDNQLEAEHLIPCNLINYIFIGATQNFKLFENATEDEMNTLNNSLPRIKLLIFNSFGKVQMSQNCINFTNNLVNRGVKFIN